MESPEPAQRCLRCDANQTWTGPDDLGPVSRTTRDDGAAIYVCRGCGESEAKRILLRLPTIDFTDWPVSVNDLLLEERPRIWFMRRSRFGLIRQDALTIEDRETPDEPEPSQIPETPRDDVGWTLNYIAHNADMLMILPDLGKVLPYAKKQLVEIEVALEDLVSDYEDVLGKGDDDSPVDEVPS